MMIAATCPSCSGKRFTTTMAPNMCGPSNNRYQSSITPMKPINRQCTTCSGSGTVNARAIDFDCWACEDSGQVDPADSHSEYHPAPVEYCRCQAGRELERIERVSAAAVAMIRHEYHSSRAAEADREHAFQLITTAAAKAS